MNLKAWLLVSCLLGVALAGCAVPEETPGATDNPTGGSDEDDTSTGGNDDGDGAGYTPPEDVADGDVTGPYASFDEALNAGGEDFYSEDEASPVVLKVLKPADLVEATTGIQEVVVLLFDEEAMAPVTDATFTLESTHVDMGHGTSDEVAPAHTAHGAYVGQTNFLMNGNWRMDLSAELADGTFLEYVVDVHVGPAEDEEEDHANMGYLHATSTLYTVDENGTGNDTGTVTFTQVGSRLYIHVDGTGLTPGEHGTHIHQVGDCSATEAEDGTKTAAGAAGGHFHPMDAAHAHHAEGLANLMADADGNLKGVLFSEMFTLAADDAMSILNRSIVIHESAGGARVACGVIEAHGDHSGDMVHTAMADVHAVDENGTGDKVGTVHYTEVKGNLFVLLQVTAGLTEGKHGTHIHENAMCGPSTRDDGTVVPAGMAGGHFNPGNASHGAHVGDLGNTVIDGNGTGTFVAFVNNLTVEQMKGLSLVIHAGGDDLVDAASAGARVACAVVSASDDGGDDHAHEMH